MEAKVLLEQLRAVLDEVRQGGSRRMDTYRSPEAVAADLGKILWDLSRPFAIKEQEEAKGRSDG